MVWHPDKLEDGLDCQACLALEPYPCTTTGHELDKRSLFMQPGDECYAGCAEHGIQRPISVNKLRERAILISHYSPGEETALSIFPVRLIVRRTGYGVRDTGYGIRDSTLSSHSLFSPAALQSTQLCSSLSGQQSTSLLPILPSPPLHLLSSPSPSPSRLSLMMLLDW